MDLMVILRAGSAELPYAIVLVAGKEARQNLNWSTVDIPTTPFTQLSLQFLQTKGLITIRQEKTEYALYNRQVTGDKIWSLGAAISDITQKVSCRNFSFIYLQSLPALGTQTPLSQCRKRTIIRLIPIHVNEPAWFRLTVTYIFFIHRTTCFLKTLRLKSQFSKLD